MRRYAVRIIAVATFVLLAIIFFYVYQFHRVPIKPEVDAEKRFVIATTNDSAIPSIDNPKFESVAIADEYLDDNGLGLIVSAGKKAKFYPYQIMVWHQIVNDSFGGKNLVVTYDPLCGFATVYERDLVNAVIEFDVSGMLLNSNLLMRDRVAGSLWSQITGAVVEGKNTDMILARYPSEVVSWSIFKNNYPNGSVLSRNTSFDRDYTRDPYRMNDYYDSAKVWFPLSHEDERMKPKTHILGIKGVDWQKAYPEDFVKENRLLNDEIEGSAILLLWNHDLNVARVFLRSIGDDVLKFESDGEFIEDESGGLWNNNGEAVSGTNRGLRLESLIVDRMYWFAWAAMYPDTRIFTQL